MQGKAIDQ